jgi:translation initiation factor RLI1
VGLFWHSFRRTAKVLRFWHQIVVIFVTEIGNFVTNLTRKSMSAIMIATTCDVIPNTLRQRRVRNLLQSDDESAQINAVPSAHCLLV